MRVKKIDDEEEGTELTEDEIMCPITRFSCDISTCTCHHISTCTYHHVHVI